MPPACDPTPSSLTYNVNTDKKITGIPDPTQCCHMCGNSSGCVAWSWEEYDSLTNGKCWLAADGPTTAGRDATAEPIRPYYEHAAERDRCPPGVSEHVPPRRRAGAGAKYP